MSGSARRRARSAAFWTILAIASATGPARGEAAARRPTAIAVVDFGYSDSSGEPRNQKAEHDARLADFTRSLRRDLEQGGAYKVVALDCGAEPCSVERLTPEELFDAARRAGARLLLFGGIHKMSTLVQWARVQVIDIEKNVVLDDRHLSFRGDTDNSWKRAEAFIVEKMKKQGAP